MLKSPKRKRNRLSNYDYSNGGVYFVTICSKDRKNIFATISNNVGTGLAPVRLELTKIGQIIDNHWRDIPNQYDNVDIDEFVIMPNHIHGILMNDNNKRTGASPVPTLSQIIGSFKSKSSLEHLKYIKQSNLNVSGQIWQRSFYDHVLRNEETLQEIRNYIINNPLNWDDDKNNINV